MTSIIQPGVISDGTLRPADLAPAFLSLLESVDPDMIGTPRHEAFIADVSMIVATDGEWDATPEVLDSLDSHINAALPEGLYFGTVEGDGACFGVFAVEDDEDY